MKSRPFVLAALVAMSAPALALAQEADEPGPALQRDPVRAAQARDEGQKLQAAGKTDEACAAFARSQAFDPHAQTLLSLALCHEKQGKLATAWTELGDAAGLFAAEKNKERETFARSHAKELEPQLSYLVLEGEDTTAVESLTVDGLGIPKPAWAKPIPLDAGEHTLSFSRVGAEPLQVKVRIPGGAAKVPYRIPVLAPSKLAQPDAAAPASPPYLGYGLVAGGVLGVGIGAVFGVSTLSAASDVKAACDAQKQCTPAGLERLDDGRASGTISTIGFVVGAVLAGAGVALIVTNKSPSKPRAALEMVLTGRGSF